MRYLAVTCARARRRQKEEGDSPTLVKERLSWNNRPFPILVRLRRHANVRSWNDAKELTNTFYDEMPPELRKRCPKEFFERYLNKGNCLILLDGFDELGSPEARVVMARRIASFLQIFNRPDNRIIVTTRIVGYEGQLNRFDFNMRSVKNLEAGEMRALVKQRYKAIAISETVGRQSQEASIIKQKLNQRAQRLIEKIENTPRLNQLATNPMLLSLIVLVHFLKVELPEERILLYRDCVEILTERWQHVRNQEAELEIKAYDELTMNQKLILLREIAFTMQQQRKDEKIQSLLPKVAVQKLIAEKLPDFIGSSFPESESAKREMSNRKAEEWIASIEVESGILVEQGLEEAGEPLIGFSHLTFQEYLAAIAINEVEAYQPLLWQNLLNPAWREVVLLYEALVEDATPIITSLLGTPAQHNGVLFAGYCLAERVKHINIHTQRLALMKLQESFIQADDDTISDFGKVMAAIGGSEVATFMRQQLNNSSQAKQLTAINVLGQMRMDDPEIEKVREDLLQITERPNSVEIIVAAREALAQIGDPRFISLEPSLVHIPRQVPKVTPSLSGWRRIFPPPPQWEKTLDSIVAHLYFLFEQLGRALDFWVFVKWHPFWRKQPQCYEFKICKYPITNFEYNRFIEGTGYRAPSTWIEGTFLLAEATHPVTGISREAAEAYCRWLSHETGQKYRLPKEWEWEWAALGTHRWLYPWGDVFDKEKCNTREADIGNTTPVGSYKEGDSPYGVSDMVGNVLEITDTRFLSSLITRILSPIISIIFIAIWVAMTLSILSIAFWPYTGIFYFLYVKISLNYITIKQIMEQYTSWISYSRTPTGIVLYLLVLFISVSAGFTTIRAFFRKITNYKYERDTVLRGGSFNESAEQATCFDRRDYLLYRGDKECGFRCVRERGGGE